MKTSIPFLPLLNTLYSNKINNSRLQSIKELTSSQQSIWASQKLDPDAISNYLPHTFELKGAIDAQIFSRAHDLLLAQNDCLRTVFVEDSTAEVQQVVHSEFPFQLELLKVSEQDISEFIDGRINKHLDLSQQCFDSLLINLSDEKNIWYLNIHHILADATTFKVLFDEMSFIYHSLMTDGKIALEPKASFAEYRSFEKRKREEEGTKSNDYWKAKGKLAPAQALLYGNQKSLHAKGARRVKLPFDSALKAKVDEKLKEEAYRSFNPDLTKFTIWTMLFTGFISRITGKSVLRIGSPFPNRNLAKYKKTPGLFIEVLPIDIEIDGDDHFQSLFNKVRDQLFDFFKHGHPGAQTMESSRGIHLIVNYIPLYFGDFGSVPTTSKWLFTHQMDSGHQIRFQAFDFNSTSNLDYYFDINEGYLTDKQIELIPAHFAHFVEAFLTDDTSKISEAILVSELEKKSLIAKGEDYPEKVESLGNLLERAFEYYSNEKSLVLDSKELSYGELDVLANKTALLLMRNEVKPGDIVAINKARSIEYIVSVLAALKIGATFVPLSVDLPKQRIDLILEDIDPKLLISSSKYFSEKYEVIDIQLEELEGFEYTDISNELAFQPDQTAYILFTSGSTGKPKGVEVSISSLSNYLNEVKKMYSNGGQVSMPFFTSIGFDLTITSLFLPFVTGGSIYIYPEAKSGPDVSILDVVKSQEINTIKLTPSHAQLIKESSFDQTNIGCVIFGGENLESSLALEIRNSISNEVKIFNEYGPTEATVGCIVHQFDPKETYLSVPIGKAIGGCTYYILDEKLNPVPQGVRGVLYLGGKVLAKGYYKNALRTAESFISNPFDSNSMLYKTGDLVALNPEGVLEYFGRVDEQIKLNGVRIESSELEALIADYPEIEEAHVIVADADEDHFDDPEFYCENCGLPSNYPDAIFNDQGVCNLCESFEEYQRNVSSYFKSMDNLKSEILGLGTDADKQYDCLMLLSGGKDSSYALAKLVELDLKVLAWTLDNGFISDNAKQNIDNTTRQLGVDHIYGSTEAMNAIFRDSLERYQNVCNGCFKTVYTLSTRIALDKKIPVIVTGLSRGQFFETRLTEELFVNDNFDPSDIDNIILEARKSYHRSKDAVSEYLDVSMFDSDEVFDKVAFVDFYRFSEVSLSEMYAYLEEKIGWKRPSDTGRSTNCIINDLGIYVHKRKKGYHNYAFPYSWDVRVGHKKREETIDELNDELSPVDIKGLMQDIGMEDLEKRKEIRAYFKSSKQVDRSKLMDHMREKLPSNMIPATYLQVDTFPLTPNGKVDKSALVRKKSILPIIDNKPLVKPKNKIEELVHGTWCTVLKMEAIDVTDSFIPLGGNSLSAIRIVSLLSKRLNLDLRIQDFFEKDSIRDFSGLIESEIKKRMGIS